MNLELELNKMSKNSPSWLEWAAAFLLFFFAFISFAYFDTVCIVRYQINFANSLLHGEFINFYDNAYNNAVYAKAHGLPGAGDPVYSVPLNFVFGIWGIPLYLYNRNTGIDFSESFWQILYGKSLFLLTFVITTILIYRICRELKLDKYKSQWGAFLYFTSVSAMHSVGIIGQCETIGMIFTLLAIIAYLRNENKKFLIWFIIAFPFKFFAFFALLPLLLLRDKNIFRILGKLALIFGVTIISGLPVRSNPAVYARYVDFYLGNFLRLANNTVTFMNAEAPLFFIAFGLLCIYCYFYKFIDEEKSFQTETKKTETETQISNSKKANTHIIFILLSSMALLFTIPGSHPYWHINLAAYLSIMMVYNGKETKNLLFFETIGFAALMFSNYIGYRFCYWPSYAKNMFLYKILGSPSFENITDTPIMQAIKYMMNSHKMNHVIRGTFDAVYIISIFTILWLCRPNSINNTEECELNNIRRYALSRLFINAMICYIPLFFVIFKVLWR